MRKEILVLAGFLIAFLGLNRAGAVVSGQRYDSGGAWASGWSGTEDDGVAAPEPDTAPPNISGQWSGSIMDSVDGTGTFGLDITQKSGKLTGTWDVSLGGGSSGKFTGSVGGSSKVSIKILTPEKKHRGCHANAKGTTSGTNITLSYKFAGCGPNSGDEFGTIDLSPI
ncbi:MAG TPA: hypothetical protein VIW95_02900 [Candidatus Binatus sp.]|uniref:hypothetical protein n=1 Tax=Candidatus Binatus sp. TaxID=2811406 RepID=UPI002F40A726